MATGVTETTTGPTLASKPIFWGAIFAGGVIAMVTQLVLSVLGIAIGASTINPLQEVNPIEGIGIGAGIYWLVSSFISLFAGGYAAGSLVAVQEPVTRTLHGLTMWGVATLLFFLMLGTGVGRIIGGTASVVGSGVGLLGDAAGALGPQIASAVGSQMDGADIDLDLARLREEARQVLRETGNPALDPDRLEERAGAVGEEAAAAGERTAADPQSLGDELGAVIDRIEREGREVISQTDREDLVNVVMARTGQSRAEASATVDNWEQTYQQAYTEARAAWDEATADAEQTAREWGDAAASGIATAAWWTFFMLLMGAVAAAVGANVGTNRRTTTTTRQTVVGTGHGGSAATVGTPSKTSAR
jgi:hypothetical protein